MAVKPAAAQLSVLGQVRWSDAYRRNAVHAITPAMRHLPATTRRLVDYLRERGAQTPGSAGRHAA